MRADSCMQSHLLATEPYLTASQLKTTSKPRVPAPNRDKLGAYLILPTVPPQGRYATADQRTFPVGLLFTNARRMHSGGLTAHVAGGVYKRPMHGCLSVTECSPHKAKHLIG